MPNGNEKKQVRIENITAILNVKNIAASKKFYVDILGFTAAEWGNDNFTSVSRDNASIYLCKGGQGCEGTWIWIGFDGDIFSLYKELKEKGVIIRSKPRNHSWALEMQIEDPDGHVLRFGTEPNTDEPYFD